MADRYVHRKHHLTYFRVVLSFFVVGLLLTVALRGSVATPVASTFAGSAVPGDVSSGKALLAPSLMLVSPKAGDFWEAGKLKPVLWSYTGLTGDVRLEYSTDGTQSWKIIVDDTPGTAGSYMWTVPGDPSTNAYVRVSSTLDATISDTNDAPFTIFRVNTFEDSYKAASPVSVEGGETVTYTIALYESDSATMRLTDTIPSSLTYETGSVRVEPAWKNPVQFIAGDIRWSDVVTRTVPVIVTFRAQVTGTTATFTIVNRVRVSRNGMAPMELTATSIVNGFAVYLPMVVKK